MRLHGTPCDLRGEFCSIHGVVVALGRFIVSPGRSGIELALDEVNFLEEGFIIIRRVMVLTYF